MISDSRQALNGGLNMRNSNQILDEIRELKEEIKFNEKTLEKHKAIMKPEFIESYIADIAKAKEKIEILNEEINKLYQ